MIRLATLSIQESIPASLFNDHGIELSLVQIGAFWQSTEIGAQILSDLLGIAKYQIGSKGQTYAGFPLGSDHLLDIVRQSGHSWVLVAQVGQTGPAVIRRVVEASEEGALNVHFEGADRV